LGHLSKSCENHHDGSRILFPNEVVIKKTRININILPRENGERRELKPLGILDEPRLYSF
jgi:hypothetical protein